MKPTGFLPRELSALHNRRVIEEHADESASLWKLRELATTAPLYRLRHLEQLDQRVLAHLEGLRAAGPYGLAIARSRLADVNAGTVFVTAYLALGTSDQSALPDLLKICLADATATAGVFGAFSFIEADRARPALALLSSSTQPRHRSLALRVEAAQRLPDVKVQAAKAMQDADPELRAAALKVIGEGKLVELRSRLADASRDDDEDCRFWAAWSLALMGEQQAAPVVLRCATGQPHLQRRAVELAMRAGEPDWARATLRQWAGDEATLRQAVIAAGAFGDPKVVPWLLHLLERPLLARVAAEALATITGVDLDESALKQSEVESDDQEHHDDQDLRWPNPDGLNDWWSAHHGRFVAGTRYLAGSPIGRAGALRVLRDGYQRQRVAAAVELALQDERATLFPCDARADWQRRTLEA